jgi:energy-coupling factor transporter transmembrane protein EcfT
MQGNNLSQAPARLTGMHRLDRRTKLLLLVASFIMVLLPENPQVVALATLLVLGQVTLTRALEARGFQMSPTRTYLLDPDNVAGRLDAEASRHSFGRLHRPPYTPLGLYSRLDRIAHHTEYF